jgi:hypothetical protein
LVKEERFLVVEHNAVPSFYETVHILEAYRSRCEDRLEVIHDGGRTIIVVADGAGGSGSGDAAAETVIREVKLIYPHVTTANDWKEALHQIDFRVSAGESTAVVVDLQASGIIGASVGDSAAWIISDGEITDLTINQMRKPLVGSQSATPVAFEHGPLSGLLLVGTDGFFAYAKRDWVPPMVSRTDFFAIPRTCLEMVRLSSGELWDDVGLIACRVRRAQQTRKRYTL